MLTPLDEGLLHQAPTTFDHATTSDHRFFDRWAVGAQHPAASVIYGMATYKNTDVCDGFFCVQAGARQINVRVSRRLRPDWSMRIGPLELSVEEPLVAHRVSLSSDRLAAFLEWRGGGPPREERPHFQRRNGRAQMDYCRFDQLGTASGWISVDGERIDLDGAFAWRDHSWGVRPGMGGPDPVSTQDASGAAPASLGSLFVWMAFRAGPVTGQFQSRQAADGTFEYVDGHLVPDIARPGTALDVSSIRHHISLTDGHTTFERALMEVTTTDGSVWAFDARPLRPPWVFMGAGYSGGWSDGLGLGVPRGDVVEADEYELLGPADVRMPEGAVAQPWHRETDAELSLDGRPGDGHLTIIARPPVPGPTLGERS